MLCLETHCMPLAHDYDIVMHTALSLYYYVMQC